MDLKLTDGRYSASPLGGLATVRGVQELGQRILMKLTARRGGFAVLPEYGSRLLTLLRVKPSERNSAARQIVAEALADEPGLSLDSLELSEPDESGAIDMVLRFLYGGEELNISAKVVDSR